MIAGAYATAAGSPGPLLRNTPSGRRASPSPAGVDPGTTSTVAISDSSRRIDDLMPKSYATTRRAPPGTRYGDAVVTSLTRSRPSVPGSASAAAFRVVSSVVPKAAGMAPASRMCRVRRRVSTPAMPGTPWRSSHAPSSSAARQLDGRRASSRTTTPRQNGLWLSSSRWVTP